MVYRLVDLQYEEDEILLCSKEVERRLEAVLCI